MVRDGTRKKKKIPLTCERGATRFVTGVPRGYIYKYLNGIVEYSDSLDAWI